MQLTKIAAALSLFVALVIGIASVYIADSRREVAAVAAPAEFKVTAVAKTSITTQMLLGSWTGTWGDDVDNCTIEINRVDGNKFYGTLRQEGAEVAFSGTFDRETRKVFIHETKVLKLGEYGGWLLGENTGVISADGLSMNGTGRDEQDEYVWSLSQTQP